MPRVALVTVQAARARDDDLAPLEAALREAGAEVHALDWDDPAAQWASHDVAVLRSPWDYTRRLPEFLQWVEQVASQTRLLNGPCVVRWNTDKHYLAELKAAGVPVVPGLYLEIGGSARATLDPWLASLEAFSEFVIKPCVGAGSWDAMRFGRADQDAAVRHARRMLSEGRGVLVQPYLERVDSWGETALIYVDGAFSHAIRKGALLRRGRESGPAMFAPELIAARDPDPAEFAVAELALAAVQRLLPREVPLLYARVDLLRDNEGAPCVLELELTEPSLFFDLGPGSAARFARAIVGRCADAANGHAGPG